MAKLNANNQTEVLRLQREVSSPKNPDLEWERMTYAFMSNGKVVGKRDVLFKPRQFLGETKAKRHSYGWHLAARYSNGEMGWRPVANKLKGDGYVEVAP